jgi:deazaflavin-dependent oxidoreductase (nitroreductase family)
VSDPGEPEFAYLTTSGRITGRAHRVELWFVREGDRVFFLAGDGDRSDWVRNLMISPDVILEIGDRRRTTRARVVSEPQEDATARRLMLEKYAPGHGDDLTEWGRTALPIAVAWPPTSPAPA